MHDDTTASLPGPLSTPTWPNGVIRFDGRDLEFGAGDVQRVPIEQVQQLEVRPRAGRFDVRIRYRAGLDRVRRGVWVEAVHEQALRTLASAVENAIPATTPDREEHQR